MPRSETRWTVARDGTLYYRGEPAGLLVLPIIGSSKRAVWKFTIKERPRSNTRARLRKGLRNGTR